MDKIALFERRNDISVNVYGCDVKKGRCSPYPLQLSKMTEAAKHIDLLLLENEEGERETTGCKQETTWRQNDDSSKHRETKGDNREKGYKILLHLNVFKKI